MARDLPRARLVRPGRSALAAGLVTGFGLGAFIDGIVLHQVLQWHHLVVAHEPANSLLGLERNTFWDGVFHLVSWVTVLIGVLWTVAQGHELRAAGVRRFAGLLLVGAGAFHVVDQLLFHLALGAHHIRMVENYQVYDWSFFALGLAMIGAGTVLQYHRGRVV